MGNCNNKIKHTCAGTQVSALCTKYESTVSEHSNLNDEDCLDVQEVIEDIYSITEDIYSKIDVSELSNDCITFIEPKTLSSVIDQIYLKLCELENTIEEQAAEILIMQQEIEDLQTNTCP
jgi:hypothetical protein